MTVRIIPRLDIKGPNIVKGVHLEGLRVVGRPELFAPRYYADGADEIIYMDTVASLYRRNNLVQIVRRAAQEIFIPLTVGGGIRAVEDIHDLLRAGADKVAINTGAIQNPQLLRDGSRAFGAQCIVLYVEAKRRAPGKYECLTDNARIQTGVDVFEWVKRAVDLGAGEILLTSVDRDGTGKGYDCELVKKVSDIVGVPVVAAGGAGNTQSVKDVIVSGAADAVCAGSIFHYALIGEFEKEMDGLEEGNIEFLKGRLPLAARLRKGIEPILIPALKDYLTGQGVACRRVGTKAVISQ